MKNMYIYMVREIGKDGILVLAKSKKQVQEKYKGCTIDKWSTPNKITIQEKFFADDLTGTTDKHYNL